MFSKKKKDNKYKKRAKRKLKHAHTSETENSHYSLVQMHRPKKNIYIFISENISRISYNVAVTFILMNDPPNTKRTNNNQQSVSSLDSVSATCLVQMTNARHDARDCHIRLVGFCRVLRSLAPITLVMRCDTSYFLCSYWLCGGWYVERDKLSSRCWC